MKKLAAVITFCLLFLTVQSFAQTEKSGSSYDPALAERLGADEYGMKSYVHVILKTGKANITDEKKRKEIFAGHFANMDRLAEKGILVAAGPFGDPDKIKRGFFIFNVKTVEEAETFVKTDPAVSSGIFDYELTKLYSSAAFMMINEIHKKIQKTEVN